MAAATAPMTDVAASSPAADSGVMRIYVHSVASDAWGPAWPVHSWAVSVCTGTSSPSLRKIKQLFKEELMRVTNMDKALLRLPIMTVGVLKRADGREISNENDAGVRVSDVLEDREDVFFELKGAPEQPTPSQKHKGGAAMAAKAAAASSSSSSSSPGISVSSNGSGGQTITFDRSPNQPLSPMEQLVYQQLLHARELQGKGQLKKARDIYLQLLASIPSEAGKGKPTTAQAEHAQSARQICHQQLGVIYLYNKQYEQARPQLEAAVKIVTSGASEANAAIVRQIGKTPQPELAQLIALVGQCYHGLGDFSEAQTHFERALKLLTPRGEESSSDANIQATIKETKVWLARALYRGNHAERAQALNIFEKLIAEDEHHIAALTYYAQIAIECGRKGEVIPYLLRALVAAQAAGATTNKGAASYEANILGRPPKPAGGAELDPQLVELIQVLLTDLVMLPDGVKTLFSELHAASSNHAALTFLAQTVKDQGGVTAAIEIYKRALAKCELDARGQASLLLNLVHTEELEYRYNEAFGRIRDYMQRNPDLRVGQLRVGDFAAAIGAIDDVYDVRLRTNSHPDVPQWCEVGKIFDEGTLHVTVPDPNAPPPKKSTATPYPADELQVLALMFTAVKMLYVCGGLQVLPALVNMLEPLRVDRDLHLTLIRNEHAYYSSIAQMLRSLPYPLPAELAAAGLDDVIYVCGDSHSMSSAWQVVKLDQCARPLLLVPRLVTGLKVWHMRPTCRFYPKRNWEAALRNIPTGASVIFNFGEIDCREGLLVAVEKGRYESVESGVHMAVDVYIKALQEQLHHKSLRVYVHPITPVLDVTRPTVKMFEACLRERIAIANEAARKAAGVSVAAPSDVKTDLIYLDFFKDLLTADGTGFNMQFHLDSTHLKPTYVQSVLRPSLNRAFVPRKSQAVSGSSASASGASSSAASSTAGMSTLDKINASLARAQMGDFGDLDDEENPDGMD